MENGARNEKRPEGYGIRELSELAGVSSRTLRYYDEIGLLHPAYTSEAGYRFYGCQQVELLWQILFYRERGLDLKQIREIIYQDDFDTMQAMERHLKELEAQQGRLERMIQTVKQTIASMRGECSMSDREKFEVFKERAVKENEEKYGAEVREKYGDDQADASNRKLLNMTQEQWQEWTGLEEQIRSRLESGVAKGLSCHSQEAGEIVLLHKKWLGYTWKQYTPQMHEGLAEMYVADERFTAYYDKKIPGCAKLLRDAICCWAEKLEA